MAEQVLPLVCWLLVVAAAASARPVSAWSRRYVAERVPGQEVRRHWPVSSAFLVALVGALGAVVVVLAQRLGGWVPLATTAVGLPVMTLLLAAGCVDASCHRLPNYLLGWAALVALAGTVALAVARGEWVRLATMLGGTLLALVVTFLLSLVGSGMGEGDVKLMGVVGLWLGGYHLLTPLVACMAGFLCCAPVLVIGLATRRISMRSMIPLGPALVAGSLIVRVATLPG